MNIHHYHIRKTGGTTINFSFLNVVSSDPEDLYEKTASSPNRQVEQNGLKVGGWRSNVIESGECFYTWSHNPFYSLNVPKSTITLTSFRDPVKRFLSYYNMLCYYRKNNINHPCMNTEGRWLGKNLSDFLSNVTDQHLKTQLFMFSPNYDINEAIDNIQKVDHIMFVESLDKDLKDLFNELNLELKSQFNAKKYNHKEDISDLEMEQLREILDGEYKLIEKVKNFKNK